MEGVDEEEKMEAVYTALWKKSSCLYFSEAVCQTVWMLMLGVCLLSTVWVYKLNLIVCRCVLCDAAWPIADG